MSQTSIQSGPPLELSAKKKIAFAALSVLVSLAFVEAAAHYVALYVKGPSLYQADPEVGYVLRPNLDVRRRFGTTNQFYRMTTDAQGRRTAPPASMRPPRGTLLLLGDSFTYGDGVGDNDNFAAHLALAGYQVINTGVPGYGTNQQLLRMRREFAAHSGIKWVVVMVTTNDAEDVRSSYASLRHRPTARLENDKLRLDEFSLPWSERLLDRSYPYAFLRRLHRAQVAQGDGMAIVAACLERIREEAKDYGCNTLFFVHDLSAPEKVPPYLEAAKNRGVTLIDLTPDLLQRSASGESLLGANNYHWNAVGHQLVARKILRIINGS